MPVVKVKDNESVDSAIRRFKRLVEKNGTSKELRKREHFQSPSAVKQRAKAAARKRLAKQLARAKAIWDKGRDRRG